MESIVAPSPVGCFADFGRTNPDFAKPDLYVQHIGGKPHLIDTLPRPLFESQLPHRHNKTFYAFLDGPARYLKSLEFGVDAGPGADTMSAVTRCQAKASAEGFKFFALQEDGRCFGGTEGSVTAMQPLPETACAENKSKDPGRGGPFANFVYKIESEAALAVLAVPETSETSYPKPVVGKQMACEKKTLFDLSPSQVFLQQYFRPEMSIKGVLTRKVSCTQLK